jgi:hypothetical protein
VVIMERSYRASRDPYRNEPCVGLALLAAFRSRSGGPDRGHPILGRILDGLVYRRKSVAYDRRDGRRRENGVATASPSELRWAASLEAVVG